MATRAAAPNVRALQAQVKRDRAARVKAHQKAVRALQKAKPAAMAAGAPLNLFAEGDSWFDYPGFDVIRGIKADAAVDPAILNLAHHGDAARDILGVTQRQRIIDMLTDTANGSFDALLFSGGGDDIAGDQFCLWLADNPGNGNAISGLDRARFAEVLGIVEAAYLDLVKVRDDHAPRCTIFAHGYDFAVPTGVGVCNLGPWLKPSLDFRGWTNRAQATQIVREALLAFDALLRRLEQSQRAFVYVRTQGTLDPARDWANELHPSEDGFQKIADVFLVALRARFPGRI